MVHLGRDAPHAYREVVMMGLGMEANVRGRTPATLRDTAGRVPIAVHNTFPVRVALHLNGDLGVARG